VDGFVRGLLFPGLKAERMMVGRVRGLKAPAPSVWRRG
jgi:hypothetical protein